MKRKLRLLSVLAALGMSAAFLYAAGPSGCANNCGNGVLDEGEACDDNNKTDGDGCDSSCELESGGTTGGGTTGGTTTGGTTGGTACASPSDCDASFSAASVCDAPSTCQGHRVDAVCTDGVCSSVSIDDDSGCTADVVAEDCATDPDAFCDGTVAQVAPVCDVCVVPADCGASFSSAPVCNDIPTCQGTRLDATCIGNVCGSESVDDDTDCVGEDCGSGTCSGGINSFCND